VEDGSGFGRRGRIDYEDDVMISIRLRYRLVRPSDLDDFHRLVQDDHVRRYLLDGQIVPREWSKERIQSSQVLFERRGVGIWLAQDKTNEELVGFCGFVEFPTMHPEPQLIYAMFERFSGKGYATEMAQTAIAEARKQAGFRVIIAGVDEVNAASLKVLDKLGFTKFSTQEGHFGDMFLMRLES
jgi:RimJ/RimL family protein N-acetyltransferase